MGFVSFLSLRRSGTLAKALQTAVRFAALAAVGMALCTWWAAPAHSAADPTVRVGDFAPNFTLDALEGPPVTLSERLGKRPVLLVFWSFFCFPCQKELPDLQAYAADAGTEPVDVVGICLDGPQFKDRLLPFVKKNNITFPLLYDRETPDFFEIAERYGVAGTPTSFLLDPSGRVRLIHLGLLDHTLLSAGAKEAKRQAFCSDLTKP